MVSEIEKIILSLTSRGGLSALLVEQHVGFALAAASRYYVMEAGHVTSAGAGAQMPTTTSAPPWQFELPGHLPRSPFEANSGFGHRGSAIRSRIAFSWPGMMSERGRLYGVSGPGGCVPRVHISPPPRMIVWLKPRCAIRREATSCSVRTLIPRYAEDGKP